MSTETNRSYFLAALFAGGLLVLGAWVIAYDFRKGGSPNPEASLASVESDPIQPRRPIGQGSLPINSRVPSPNDPDGVSEREELISQIVVSGRPYDQISTQLLELLPTSRGAEQILAASHLGHLAEGEQFDQLVKLLSHPKVARKAKEEIFNAIFLRDPKQVASSLIQVIEDGNQEYVDEAERALSILLQADKGLDVAAWRSELDAQGEFFNEALAE